MVSLAVPENEGVVSFEGEAGWSSVTAGPWSDAPTGDATRSQEACATPFGGNESTAAGGRAAAGAAPMVGAASTTASGGTAASQRIVLHALALRLRCTAHRSKSHQVQALLCERAGRAPTPAQRQATIASGPSHYECCKILVALDPDTDVVIDVALVTGGGGQEVKRGGLTRRRVMAVLTALALALPASALAGGALAGRTYEGGAPGWGVNREGHRLRTHATGNVVLKVSRSGRRLTVRFASNRPVLYCNTQQQIHVQSGRSASIKSDGTFKAAVGERFKAGPGPPAIVQVVRGRFKGSNVSGTISTHAAECGGSSRFSARAR